MGRSELPVASVRMALCKDTVLGSISSNSMDKISRPICEKLEGPAPREDKGLTPAFFRGDRFGYLQPPSNDRIHRKKVDLL